MIEDLDQIVESEPDLFERVAVGRCCQLNSSVEEQIEQFPTRVDVADRLAKTGRGELHHDVSGCHALGESTLVVHKTGRAMTGDLDDIEVGEHIDGPALGEVEHRVDVLGEQLIEVSLLPPAGECFGVVSVKEPFVEPVNRPQEYVERVLIEQRPHGRHRPGQVVDLKADENRQSGLLSVSERRHIRVKIGSALNLENMGGCLSTRTDCGSPPVGHDRLGDAGEPMRVLSDRNLRDTSGDSYLAVPLELLKRRSRGPRPVRPHVKMEIEHTPDHPIPRLGTAPRNFSNTRSMLSRPALADWVDHLCAIDGSEKVSDYRDQAENLADALDTSDQRVEILNEIVGAALGTRDSTSRSKARAAGVPFDQSRVTRFKLLADHLRAVVTTHHALAQDAARRATLPFLEAAAPWRVSPGRPYSIGAVFWGEVELEPEVGGWYVALDEEDQGRVGSTSITWPGKDHCSMSPTRNSWMASSGSCGSTSEAGLRGLRTRSRRDGGSFC